MYTAPDGSEWHAGVRWYYDGAYHKIPQPYKPKRKGAYYHVFVLVADHLTKRVYEMQPGDQVLVNPAELARRFANSHITDRERFDPNAHWSP